MAIRALCERRPDSYLFHQVSRFVNRQIMPQFLTGEVYKLADDTMADSVHHALYHPRSEVPTLALLTLPLTLI